MTFSIIKGGLTSLWPRVPNHCLEYYPQKKKLLKTVIWHTFLEKNFQRLSHLYKNTKEFQVVLFKGREKVLKGFATCG